MLLLPKGGEHMEVELYQTEAGDEVVAEFLASLPHKDMAKVLRDIDLLAEFGTDLRQPYTKHIDGPIWELRTKFSSNIYRIFYFVKNESRLVLLHGFTKKTAKTPAAEIRIAKARFADYEKRNP